VRREIVKRFALGNVSESFSDSEMKGLKGGKKENGCYHIRFNDGSVYYVDVCEDGLAYCFETGGICQYCF
jgi:hypothetical protein